MGNHRINVAGNLFYSLEESTIFTSYYYLKKQTNYGVSLFHYKTYYRSYNWNIFSDRVYGGSVFASRPFSKFTRLDLGLNILNIERDAYSVSRYVSYGGYYGYPYAMYESQKLDGVRSMTIDANYVKDTTLWSYTGPANGVRYKLNAEYSPSLPFNNMSYTTFEADFRKYFRFGRKYNIVTRFSGGASFGESPRMFFLGGTDNWLNAKIASIPSYMEMRQDIFFARFPSPLRGYRYYEEYGRKYFLANFEFRFPFIQYLVFGWPIPLAIGNISGTLFTDIGSAWEKYEEKDGKVYLDKTFHGGGRSDEGSFRLDDIKMSWGFGVRMNLGFAVVRLDSAWRTNLDTKGNKPMICLSIGPDF